MLELEINPLSLCSIKLDILDKDKAKITSASGCLIRSSNEARYLVTNRHVVTGKNQHTGELISAHEPRFLRVKFRVFDEQKRLSMLTSDVPVRQNETCVPLWTEHPTLNAAVDVVAIKIDIAHNVTTWCANNVLFAREPMGGVGSQIFIIGFPKGLSGGTNLPIWKSGIIAAEPTDQYGLENWLLVDAKTTDGQSGSPVFMATKGERSQSAVNLGDDQPSVVMGVPGANIDLSKLPSGTRITSEDTALFLGIYSGRMMYSIDGFQCTDPSPKDLVSDIGKVWRADIVQEVVEAAAKRDAEIKNQLFIRKIG